MKTMNELRKIAVLLLIAAAVGFAGGCEKKKNAGEKVGDAIEDAGDAIEDASD